MYNAHFLGMHLFWWFILLFVFVVFFFYDTPVRRRKNNPLRILRQRLAAGEISVEEYKERYALLTGKEGKAKGQQASALNNSNTTTA